MLYARRHSTASEVRVEREEDVSDEAWFQISRLLAPGEAVHQQRPLIVSLARFLGERRRLVAILKPRGIAFRPDDRLRELLERARDEEEAVRELLERPPPENAEPAPSPRGRFRRSLSWFQLRDYTKLARLRHGANFSVPGAGKTTVAYAIYEIERFRGRVEQALVVAPLSAFEAWETEAFECFAEPPTVSRFTTAYIASGAEVLLVTYHRLPGELDRIAEWCSRRPTHIILDEAHRMKRGRPGAWASACLDISLLAARRDILTGTPAPNQPVDLLALLDFLWPRPGGRRILPEQALLPDPPDWAMQMVNQRIQPLFVRTTKDELGLPPVGVKAVRVDMGPLQAAIYSALRRQYCGVLDLSRRDAAMLGQLGEIAIHLLQAASNPKLLARSSLPGVAYAYPPAPLSPDARLAELIEEASYHQHEVPAKWIALAQILTENRNMGRKTVVWSNFPENLLDLERQLAALRPALVYGGVPSEGQGVAPGTRTREAEIRRFSENDDCWVLLANPQATAEGVSLHRACHDAVYLDRTFNAAQYLQSVDRIHRLGLQPSDETRVTILLSTDTIDETVAIRVAEKSVRLSQMLNDPLLVEMALPDDEDYGPVLDSQADLIALFEHLASGWGDRGGPDDG